MNLSAFLNNSIFTFPIDSFILKGKIFNDNSGLTILSKGQKAGERVQLKFPPNSDIFVGFQ
jgi:hypothetical protein